MPPILLSKYGSAARKPHLASQLTQILTLGKFLQDAVKLDEFDDCYGLLALRRLRAALLVSCEIKAVVFGLLRAISREDPPRRSSKIPNLFASVF